MTRPTGQARAAGWSAAALAVLALAVLAANSGPAALGFAVIAVLAALLALAVLIAAVDTLVDVLLLEDPTDSPPEPAATRRAGRAPSP